MHRAPAPTWLRCSDLVGYLIRKVCVGTDGDFSLGRPRSAAIDTAILRAALEVMAREGFARMSLGAIARAAGVSVPTVRLRYPGGKADVATAALADKRFRSEQPDSGDLRADLVAQLQRLRGRLERPFGVAMVGTVLAEEHHTPVARRHGACPDRSSQSTHSTPVAIT